MSSSWIAPNSRCRCHASTGGSSSASHALPVAQLGSEPGELLPHVGGNGRRDPLEQQAVVERGQFANHIDDWQERQLLAQIQTSAREHDPSAGDRRLGGRGEQVGLADTRLARQHQQRAVAPSEQRVDHDRQFSYAPDERGDRGHRTSGTGFKAAVNGESQPRRASRPSRPARSTTRVAAGARARRARVSDRCTRQVSTSGTRAG